MKIIAGTGRKKEKEANEERGEFTKKTSGEPAKKANDLKIPKSVTDDPVKHRYQRSVRPIANGHITEHSYTHPESGEYMRHEFYTEEDPFTEIKGV